MVSREFVTAPKRVMIVEAVLLYRCGMMEGKEKQNEERSQVRQDIGRFRKEQNRLTKLLRVVPLR